MLQRRIDLIDQRYTVVSCADTEAESWMRAIDQAVKGHEDTGGQGINSCCIITSHE